MNLSTKLSTKLNDQRPPKLKLAPKSIRATFTKLSDRLSSRLPLESAFRPISSLTSRFKLLAALVTKSGNAANDYTLAEPPMRAELFSVEQMERHGKVLADLHQLSTTQRSDRLLARLVENYGVLIWACGILTTAVKAKQRITPAGEWLIDNFYLISCAEPVELKVRIQNGALLPMTLACSGWKKCFVCAQSILA